VAENLAVLDLFVIRTLNDLKSVNGARLVKRIVLTVQSYDSILSIISNLVIAELPLSQGEH
jgi:hypothetical protein